MLRGCGRLRSRKSARLSREIHDTLGHHLTAAKLQLEHARRYRESDPEAAWEEVEESKDLIRSALAEVRRSVRALRPLALEESTGSGAFAALVRSFEGTGPEVSFSVEGEERELPAAVELALYRAMQEGLACPVSRTAPPGMHVLRAAAKAHESASFIDHGLV